MAENEIKVASCTVAELFSETIKIQGKTISATETDISGKLDIPEYQRPYVWTKTEVDKLLSDINQNDKPMYYLGSIILHEHDDELSIIDGQQRLITLAIIQYIKEKEKTPHIKSVSFKQIKENHEHLKQKSEDLHCIDFNKLNVTLVVTNNEDDAYTFFETQNAAGVRLSGVDIIKAHHLREIPEEKVDDYARKWEALKKIEIIISHLIKARRWDVLFWNDVPSYKKTEDVKQAIIEDFSEETFNEETIQRTLQYKFDIRQPLASGVDFIDYLKQFADLYQLLFKEKSNLEISEKYYDFNKKIIQGKIDGTAYLKELYEISMLCYANKFGVKDLLEASCWIFRYAYSLRISNDKMVREDSIPAFLKGNPIFDIILSSFNHKQLIKRLKQFPNKINLKNSIENTCKKRFIDKIKEYFGFADLLDLNKFDERLKVEINKNGKSNYGK